MNDNTIVEGTKHVLTSYSYDKSALAAGTLLALDAFAALLEREQLARLALDRLDCEANQLYAKTSVRIGQKWARIDIGNSGRYMVVLETREIFGIKAYGVIHRGHAFGTLDTVNDWSWGGYRAERKRV